MAKKPRKPDPPSIVINSNNFEKGDYGTKITIYQHTGTDKKANGSGSVIVYYDDKKNRKTNKNSKKDKKSKNEFENTHGLEINNGIKIKSSVNNTNALEKPRSNRRHTITSVPPKSENKLFSNEFDAETKNLDLKANKYEHQVSDDKAFLTSTLKKGECRNKNYERSKSVDCGKKRMRLQESKKQGWFDWIREPLKRTMSVDRSRMRKRKNQSTDTTFRSTVSVAKSEDCLNSMVENLKICDSLLQLSKITPTLNPEICGILPDGKCNTELEKSKREKAHQHQQLKQRGIRIKKQDPRRKSDTFLTVNKNKEQRYEELAMHPDRTDGKMLAKATKVLQEHVKDVTEKTKNNCCVGKTLQQKENMVIPNYNTNEPNTVHYIVDNNSGITYVRGKLLGKGGFAKCYELTDVKTNKTYAGKIISKSRLTKPHQKEKIAREIDLHRNLKHRNVVSFHSYFEDDHNVYIVLENCSRKSLVHVLKSRKTLTEPEARYYLYHLICGTRYIHKEKIIHRDLKLGNMLLNEKMDVKLADFGLATKVEYDGEKKMTVCGTPNYIAPEVLQKKGHSYPADVWAMGCVLYALLVGRPPFETTTLKETYMRITANKYAFPLHISKPTKHFIQKLLHPDPDQRPSLEKMLQDDFFTAGYLPKTLPTSCCDSAPKWPSNSHTPQRPKSYAAPVSPSEAMHKITTSLAQWKGSKKASSQTITQQSAKDDLQIPLSSNNRQQLHHTPTPSVISEPGRKSSRDRSPHHQHHHNQQQPPQTGSTNNQQPQKHSRSRSSDNSSSNRRHQHQDQKNQHPRSKSPPKSPRQVIIETKSAPSNNNQQETNNNIINNAHHHNNLNGYHPAMVLCSGSGNATNNANSHYGSGVKMYSSSTTIASSQPVLPQSQQQPLPSPTSVLAQSTPINSNTTTNNQQQQQLRPSSTSDPKGLPAGSAIRLYQLLTTCLDQMPRDANPTPVHDAKPLWVTKWVDYSNKYGFGFQLSDKSVGVLFNDTTRMLLAPDGRTIQYNDLSNRVYTFTTESAPEEHKKKSTLLLYFGQYMGEHLIHGGDLLQHQPVEPTAIFMKKWFRTGKAIVMYLNNGTLQVNFFDDHTKVILSPEGQDYLITYINSSRQALSYRLLQFRHFGCKPDIAERLTYARKMLESIINIEGETV